MHRPVRSPDGDSPRAGPLSSSNRRRSSGVPSRLRAAISSSSPNAMRPVRSEPSSSVRRQVISPVPAGRTSSTAGGPASARDTCTGGKGRSHSARSKSSSALRACASSVASTPIAANRLRFVSLVVSTISPLAFRNWGSIPMRSASSSRACSRPCRRLRQTSGPSKAQRCRHGRLHPPARARGRVRPETPVWA